MNRRESDLQFLDDRVSDGLRALIVGAVYGFACGSLLTYLVMR